MEQTETVPGAMVGEQRGHTRFHFLMRVDITMAGSGETYRGSVRNLSRTGVALYIRQHLKMNQKVTVHFRFLSAEGREATEELTAKVIWWSWDNMGLAFDTPLATGSPALQQAPNLVWYLAEKEAGR
jgi:hypothetical protein